MQFWCKNMFVNQLIKMAVHGDTKKLHSFQTNCIIVFIQCVDMTNLLLRKNKQLITLYSYWL